MCSWAGEDALLFEYEASIDPSVNRKVRLLAAAIEQARFVSVIEVVPAYRSLMVYFDPEEANVAELTQSITRLASGPNEAQLPDPRVFRVPTVYGTTHAPDLARVAEAAGMTSEQVVEMFSSQRYAVYCLGFLCCLAYMGGVPRRLQLPRLATPRPRLPAGSVGLAGAQAVMLPIDQPSGFHFIGRTFVTLYDPARFPPTWIRPGDLVQCPAVSEKEALGWKGRPLGDCIVEGVSRS